MFICHASPDAGAAQRVAAALERAGIDCWIAPRDIAPGENYTQAILEALAAAPALVLVFSGATNESPHVQRELETVVGSGTRIIPVRLEAVEPSPALRYFIGTAQWLDTAGVLQSTWEPLLVEAAQRALGAAPSPATTAYPVPTTPPRPRSRYVVPLTVLAVAVIAVAITAVVKLMGNDDASDDGATGNDSSVDQSSSPPTSASTSQSPSMPATTAPSSQSTGPQSSPVSGTVVVEERFEGHTAFPLGSYDSNRGKMVSSLLPGALRLSVANTSDGWDSWVSVNTPSPVAEWTVTATFVSARADGACGVMASDGSTVVTADLDRAAASARISIYRNQTVLAQKSFTAPSVTGPLSISREGGLLVMRAGDVVVASLPPQRLDPVSQGGVVGVGNTNDCDFDDFAILSRP